MPLREVKPLERGSTLVQSKSKPLVHDQSAKSKSIVQHPSFNDTERLLQFLPRVYKQSTEHLSRGYTHTPLYQAYHSYQTQIHADYDFTTSNQNFTCLNKIDQQVYDSDNIYYKIPLKEIKIRKYIQSN